MLGIRSWELHHEHRRETLFHAKWVRRLKSLILKGKCRVWCEVDWGRRIFEKYLGHFWVVILELGAETLSESRFVYAWPAHIGFGSWCCQNYGLFDPNYGFFGPGRVDFWRNCSRTNRLRYRFFLPSKTRGYRASTNAQVGQIPSFQIHQDFEKWPIYFPDPDPP